MWKRWIAVLLVAALGILPQGKAVASSPDPWAIAAQALGIYGMYKSALTDLLRIGNNVHAQVSSRRQDLRENGQDRNPMDVQLVDRVMKQLIDKGEYAMQVNSLPFLWAVNDSNRFNASCYPTNYISVNRGLVRGLNSDEDEIAAVLAHEMVHGLRQHSAHNYAQAVAQAMGITLLGMETSNVDWQKLNGLVGYSIATNISMPMEAEADEEGFFIMTSAGFNPGGPAAAMARMQHYLRYETRDMYEFDSPDKKDQTEYSDHPETEDREKRLAELMTEYSCGHVTVRDQKDVLIDGELFLSVGDTGASYDNTMENAYGVAGALAKAFHDHDTIEGWDFYTDEQGRMDCLTDDRVYRVLKEFAGNAETMQRLENLVTAAYGRETDAEGRVKLQEKERKRMDELEKIRQQASSADKKFAEKLRYNSDAYSDYGMSEMAMVEMERAMKSEKQDNMAECYVIRGRARAVAGDFAGALEDAGKGICMDGSNALNYLNRADIYRMMGDREKAMEDCAKARDLDGKSAVAWLLTAEIYDEMDQREQALDAYRTLHSLDSKAEIPKEYLKEIDPKAFARMEKEEAKKAQEMKEQEDAAEEKGA